MSKSVVGWAAFTGIVLATAASHAARVVWEFDSSSKGLPHSVPARIHQLTPNDVRIFNETAGVVSMISLGLDSLLVGPGPRKIRMPVERPYLTGDGSLALINTGGVGDGSYYAQVFDLELRMFVGNPTPLERVQQCSLGPRCVALFLGAGEPKHRTELLDELHLSVLASSQNGCRLSEVWQSREYTFPVALNSNSIGDVVALAARCKSGAMQYDCPTYRLIVARDEMPVFDAEVRDVGIDPSAAKVAISDSGDFVAVASGMSVHLFQIREAFIEPLAIRDLRACGQDSHVLCVSVADDLSIAGVAVSKGKAEVFSMPASGPCTIAMDLPIDDVMVFDVRFVTEDRFYVKTMARSAPAAQFVMFEP